jgi:hypothetical protein
MGWTLGYLPPKEPDLLDAFLLSVGKALCLSNGFEAKCKDVLGVITLTDAIQAGSDFDAASGLARAVQAMLLGGTIKLIGDASGTSPADVAILQAAREARNYIAHESAELGTLSDATVKTILRLFAELEPRVLEVAKGDNLVSAWCYEICEREPAPQGIQDQYVQMVSHWVFRGAPRDADGNWSYLSIIPAGPGNSV